MTPTVRITGSTAKACHNERSNPAALISSRTMASAARTMATRSRVMAPITRTPNPGPGKGWRQVISSGSPSCAPTARTSSLNRSRNGSTNSKSMSSGKPPTL